MVNDIRRIYTDGRDHVPAEDRYPISNGDSIGFWDGPKLVIHTNQLQGRHLSAPASRLHRSGRDRRDLAEGRRQDAERRRLGLRSAGAGRAVVRQAVVLQAERSGQEPAHPLLELRREPEQRRRPDERGRHAVPRIHIRQRRWRAQGRGAERQAMIRAFTTAVLALGALAVTAVPGLAHHSATMFDEKKTVTVEGVVKKFEYTNPHSWLLVDVTGKDGKVDDVGIRGRGAEHAAARGHQSERFQGRARS